MKSHKKLVSGLLIAVMVIASASGCSKSTPSNSGTEGTAASQSAETTSAEQTADASQGSKHVPNLIIGTTASNNVFNASTQTDAFGRMNYNGLTQGNFVYRDENNVVKPYFFQSYEISADGMELDFTFPLDAVWHDGQPVTSDDVLFTFDFMKNVKKIGSLQNLESWELTSDNSCKLTFSQPDAYYWLNSTVNNNACLFAKHIWENIDDPSNYTGEDAAIGCGPYKLVSKDTDAQTSYYEAVPENNYAGEITVDAVTLQTYSGEDTLMMAMMNGEIDAMFNYANPIDAPIIETVKGSPDIDLGESAYAGQYQLTYGMERTPCDDLQFRQAIRYALDYTQLATTINGDYGTAPGSGIIPPACKGYDASLPMLSQDLDKANAILDEAGYLDSNNDGYREYPDGSVLDVMVTPQYSKSMDLINRIADVIMASLDKVNIKNHIDQESLSNSEVWENNVTEGKYDLSIGYTTSGMATYTSAFRYFISEPRQEESGWFWGTYHDQDFKDTYYSMVQAISEEEYVSKIKKLQNMASEQVFAQALAWEKAFFPYRTDKYAGWNNYPSWGVINSRTWFDLTAK